MSVPVDTQSYHHTIHFLLLVVVFCFQQKSSLYGISQYNFAQMTVTTHLRDVISTDVRRGHHRSLR